jgi:hypothetical protein
VDKLLTEHERLESVGLEMDAPFFPLAIVQNGIDHCNMSEK